MMERRMTVSGLEVREDSGALTMTGYASTFNEPYDMGWYTESVAPDAFKRTLGRSPDVRLLINHDGLPLARTTSGTLRLAADSRGLHVEAEMDPSDPDVQRLVPKMQRGDLNQMSFGFRIDGKDGDSWSHDLASRELRVLDLNNGDVSVVTYPANPNTAVGVRADGVAAHAEAIQSALAALSTRAAATEDFASVLARALGYFTAVDAIVDSAQDEIASILGIPNPDDDEASESPTTEADEAARAALARLEMRRRALRLASL